MAEAVAVGEIITIEITASEVSDRIDRVLTERLGIPRNQIQHWIRSGRITVDGHPVKGSHHVAAGEIYYCDPPGRDLQAGMEPEVGELSILFEDRHLVVLDKPAGLVVHPGAGRRQGTLAHRLLARYPEMAEVGGPGRPGIVHRLDKDTTGVLIVARSGEAYQRLSAAFSERRVIKRYLALVYGTPRTEGGEIDRPVGRHPQRRREMAVLPQGRPALTRYRCLASRAGIALLELDLATGRTHQIRVHLKSLGHPLIGDPTYGEARWKAMPKQLQAPLSRFARPALHAWCLKLEHPVRHEVMEFEAPLPADLSSLWQEVTGTPFPDLPPREITREA